MTPQQINSYISTYVRDNLSPTPEQRIYVTDKYEQLSVFLGRSCFQSGSYPRFTATRPIKDLDVIWVTDDHSMTDNPRSVLDSLSYELDRAYRLAGRSLPKITTQNHSIMLAFEDHENAFSIDVVPGIQQSEENEFGDPLYCVPEIQKMSHMVRRSFEGAASWIMSDPKGYIIAASSLDDTTDGRFRKATKFVKAWRRKQKLMYGDDFKLKSFHLELIVTAYLAANPDATLLDAIIASIAAVPRAIQQPQIRDRADADQFVDQYVSDLSFEDRGLILRLQSEAHSTVVSMMSAESPTSLNALLDFLTRPKTTTPIAAAQVAVVRPREPWAW